MAYYSLDILKLLNNIISNNIMMMKALSTMWYMKRSLYQHTPTE